MTQDEGADDVWDFLPKRTEKPVSAEREATIPAESAPTITPPPAVTPAPKSSDDAWDFLATRKSEVQARGEQASIPDAVVTRREHGEFRADMGGESLKRRALPMALVLLLVSIAGFLTETVAATQIISLGGPKALLIVYPLGGIGLLLLALMQFKFVDQSARLKVLRIAGLSYAAVFILALIALGASIGPIIAIAVIYLLGDQLNFLVPLLIWSLAGDEFNVAEGRKIFGWIVAWTYAGQVLGLLIAATSPLLLDAIDMPLTTLLVIDPLVCLAVGIWLPRHLKGTFAASGLNRSESLKESLGSARDFINGVPVWRSFFFASIITFIGGMTLFIGFMSGEDEIIGSDASKLQMYFGFVMLASLIVCLLIQIFAAERLLERLGIPGVLMVLPIATAAGGILVAVGIATGSLIWLGFGLAAWFIPRWSIDENARRSALALVPDERRTRVSFLVDLVPVSIGLIIAGPIAAIGIFTDRLWIVPIAAVMVSAGAIPLSVKVRKGWEDSLLNWRLRRRKQNRSIILGDDTYE
jgi:hypothetical protein